MNKLSITHHLTVFTTLVFLFFPNQVQSQKLNGDKTLDSRVEKYLEEHTHEFRDMNVPTKDGKLLYSLIIEGNYTKALEIGTSTGLSGIYLAWALSKTDGKLITIEIDERRHKIALKHFEQAGLSEYVDARLADAHTLVKSLEGPFDFVFSDADKNWYKQYFLDLDPKLVVGGCYTAHNVSDKRGGWNYNYYEFVKGLDHYNTALHPGSSLLVSYKTADKTP
ncbi:MAG: class I SAM-dependent methyltransferase [Bacteroidales bacterium]